MNPQTTSPALSADAIINSIQNLLWRAGPYDAWTIGVAQDVVKACSTRDTSGLWNDWLTDTEADARCVLAHFTRLGITLDAASDQTGNYVYIFRARDMRTSTNTPSSASRPLKGLRIVVADDHALLRNAVVQLLERHGMEVVGQAATGDAAVLLAGKLSPDVVVMDVSMPGGISGIEATSRLRDILPRCRVIGFSVDHDPRARAQMIAAGAVAYVPKDDPPDALLAAIRKCTHTPLPPSPKRAQVESTRKR